jgi:RNA polymerase sigma-70 factor (ECF subfamily)
MMRVTQAVLGGAHPDVEDVMQQSLIALVQALPSFRGECEPIHYASRIAARIAIATRKRARVARDRRDDAVEIDALSSREGHPQDATNATRRKEAVLQLLSEIPEEQAESMALRFVLGWSLEEISRAMTTPVNTVRSRLRLAKEALRRKIEEEPALAELLEVDA